MEAGNGCTGRARKRPAAYFYTLYNRRRYWTGRYSMEEVSLPGGRLFSDGIYPTKLTFEDLPEWYVEVYEGKLWGRLDAKRVTQLVYAPNYFFNHVYKDDRLYVSYDPARPIRLDAEYYKRWGGGLPEGEFLPGERRLRCYTGYRYSVSGPCMMTFVEAAAAYGYDAGACAAMLKEMKWKEEWYRKTWPRGRGC